MSYLRSSRSAFTLIELLIVIAIIAVLAVVVILVINPVEILRQSRDSTRVSDMATLSQALGVFSADQSTGSLGSPSVLYVSIPDAAATSTAGDQCQGLGLPTLPSTWTYHCAATSSYKNTDGTGWIPVALKNISSGSPLGSLPTDPTNTSSSRLYYAYATDGTRFEVTAAMESQKYKLGGSNDVITTDGGTLASVYEKGSKLGLEPMDYGDTSLVGYWPLDEGAGAVAYDYSGNNNAGSFTGSPTWQTSGCELQEGCLDFPTGTNDISVPSTSSLNITDNLTITMWIKANTLVPSGASPHPINKWTGTTDANYTLYYCGNGCGSNNVFRWRANAGGTWGDVAAPTPTISTGMWNHVALVYTSGGGGQMYWNGVAQGSFGGGGLLATSINPLFIGNDGGAAGTDFNMNAVRIYNRALSAGEIQAMYNGQK